MPHNTFFGNLEVPGPNGTLPVPPQLLHKNTTTVNQILGLPGMFSTFSGHDLRNLRILAITASSLSIVSCVVSVFFLLNIDRRRRTFRHDLVFFLFICDLVKAFVLMIYPLVILVRNDVYSSPQFYNTLGWFTAYCVEGADLAIFFFAIHFALLIFKPSWKWRNKRSKNVEGGLYQFRAYIWPITALAPLVLASLAFVNFKLIDTQDLIDNTVVVLDNNNYHFDDFAKLGGYKPYSAWCYLPPFPLWYKLVLSWGPRYFVIVFIFVLYLSIYIFVRRQSSRIKSQIHDFKHKQEAEREKARIKTSLGMLLWGIQKYVLIPFLHILKNLRNFLFLSLEDSSDSSRGKSIPSSLFSYRAEDDASCISNHATNSNRKSEYYASKMNESSIRYVPGVAMDESKNGEISNNNRGFKSLSDLQNIAPTEVNANPKRISITGKGFYHYSENDVVKVTNEAHHEVPGPNQGDNSFQTFFSPIEQPFIKNDSVEEDRISNGHQEVGPQTVVQGESTFNEVQATFQKQTYADMKKRRMQIQKNLRSIFVYPFSYIAIWIFPLIVDATQYNIEPIHGPVVWLVYLATIAQPLNGFVDAVVFLYREKPWKYSWRDVQAKELAEKCHAKGDMDRKDLYELYNSDWGRKGWYYCGRFKKKECLRHKPQRWKRAIWFVNRFFVGLIRNNFSYEDNCDDSSYWSRYYLLDRNCQPTDGSKSAPHERQLSFPSDSTTTSDCFINGLSYVEVPTFWRFIHLFPMLKGVDLDELNRELRLKTLGDEFSGRTAPRNLSTPECSANMSIFKPNYSVGGSGKTGFSQEKFHLEPSYTHDNFNLNTDFSDVVKNLAPTSMDAHNHDDENKVQTNDDMDMMAFLKGSSSLA